jgi:hydrogenase expression/formation protein HypC
MERRTTMCLGIPGEVLRVADDELRTSRVRFGGIVKEVSLVYVPQAEAGDFVVVHAGFAISRLDREAAERVFSYLEQLDATRELSDGER